MVQFRWVWTRADRACSGVSWANARLHIPHPHPLEMLPSA